MMSKINENAESLLTLAVANPDGFTRPDACVELELTQAQFGQAVRRLRRILKDGEASLICDPAEARAPWTYRIVSEVAEGSPWVHNRLTDTASRVSTLANIATTLVNATDPNTLEGRIARKMLKGATRLTEDIEEIRTEAMSA